jgi:hypothetical protein
LFRKWIREQKKAGVPAEEIKDILISVKLSSSEEWLILEGQESKAFLYAESSVGRNFWETLCTFSGELKALEIVPAKGKLGFDLEPSETEVGYWKYFDEDEEVTCAIGSAEVKKRKSSGLSELTLAAMQVKKSTPKKP